MARENGVPEVQEPHERPDREHSRGRHHPVHDLLRALLSSRRGVVVRIESGLSTAAGDEGSRFCLSALLAQASPESTIGTCVATTAAGSKRRENQSITS